jgi:hypothetical protein
MTSSLRVRRKAQMKPLPAQWPIAPTIASMRPSVRIEGPLVISYSPRSGELVVDAVEPHPHVKGGARWRLTFSQDATQQLIRALARVEAALDAANDS